MPDNIATYIENVKVSASDTQINDFPRLVQSATEIASGLTQLAGQ